MNLCRSRKRIQNERCLDFARHDKMTHPGLNLSPEKKIAGVLVPLFALRGEDDLGIGDIGALREFIDWVAQIGFKLVQLLPINETGADNSPYNAISAMAIEPSHAASRARTRYRI